MGNGSWYTHVRDGGCALWFRPLFQCNLFRVFPAPSRPAVPTEAQPQVHMPIKYGGLKLPGCSETPPST
eukprot:12885331-Prorocentrum_lima.AAC.1